MKTKTLIYIILAILLVIVIAGGSYGLFIFLENKALEEELEKNDSTDISSGDKENNSDTDDEVVNAKLDILVNDVALDKEGSYAVGENSNLVLNVTADYASYKGYDVELMVNPSVEDFSFTMDGSEYMFKGENFLKYITVNVDGSKVEISCANDIKDILFIKYPYVKSIEFNSLPDYFNGLFALKITTKDKLCTEYVPFNLGGVNGVLLACGPDSIKV